MLATLALIHKISVSLFLLSYIIRLIGLLGNIEAIKNLYAKKSMRMLVDMFISTVFLVTGVWLMLKIPGSMITMMLLLKVVLVLISIPIAIIGFKKNKKALALLSVVMLIGAYGLGEMNKRNPVVMKDILPAASNNGQLFNAAQCNACHGADGGAPVDGVKNLKESTLAAADVRTIITKGKSIMPGYGKKLTPVQIDSLVNYVMQVRTAK